MKKIEKFASTVNIIKTLPIGLNIFCKKDLTNMYTKKNLTLSSLHSKQIYGDKFSASSYMDKNKDTYEFHGKISDINFNFTTNKTVIPVTNDNTIWSGIGCYNDKIMVTYIDLNNDFFSRIRFEDKDESIEIYIGNNSLEPKEAD